MRRTTTAIAVILLAACSAMAERVKDITSIKGIRTNPLQGYGIVIGLDQTGDDSPVTRRALASMLRKNPQMSVDLEDVASKSIASVIVTADLPPFGRSGSTIDVTVAVTQDSTSLQGGVLLMTPLMGADGEVYAVAEGPLALGGFGASGEKTTVKENALTVARIPAGAIIEQEEIAEFVENGNITLLLNNSDFTTAQRIADAVGALVGEGVTVIDAGTVQVAIPPDLQREDLAAFISRIGEVQVVSDSPAVVVVNERTGTIIIGKDVTIATVGISHGSLSIVVQEEDYVSQPLPFSNTGTTTTTHRTRVNVTEERGPVGVIPRTTNVADLARALNAMGLTPRDIIAIFQALKEAGALNAELKVM